MTSTGLTMTGGITSHAAVVARGMGRPCIVGAGRNSGADAGAVDLASRTLRVGDVVVKEGERLSIDGATGEVMAVGRAVQVAIARLVSGVISESWATVPVGE